MALLEVKIKRLSNDFLDIPLPSYKTEGSAGMDICATLVEDIVIPAGGIVLAPKSPSSCHKYYQAISHRYKKLEKSMILTIKCISFLSLLNSSRTKTAYSTLTFFQLISKLPLNKFVLRYY